MDLLERAILCTLHSVNGVGTKSLWKIKDAFGSFRACYEASSNRLHSSFLTPEVVEGIMKKRSAVDPEEYLREMACRDIECLSCEDEAYPARLRHISNPPYIFYYRGEIEANDWPGIAIVGSRQASSYGKNTARRLGAELAARGVTVVSGMARGIDSEAHRGALDKGKTIAVMGSGLDVIYPPENARLCEEIVQAGAVISEFPLHTERNRVTSPCATELFPVCVGELWWWRPK